MTTGAPVWRVADIAEAHFMGGVALVKLQIQSDHPAIAE